MGNKIEVDRFLKGSHLGLYLGVWAETSRLFLFIFEFHFQFGPLNPYSAVAKTIFVRSLIFHMRVEIHDL